MINKLTVTNNKMAALGLKNIEDWNPMFFKKHRVSI